tara:strand:+ start:76 stop:384 length:309 start_codon:yes stop_codon:yes gene_type:complete
MSDPKYKYVNGERMELTDDEIAAILADREAFDLDFHHIRIQRDSLLKASDWTQIADASLGAHTAEEWATYRQELRDLPAGFSRVSEVVFPDDPPTAAAKAAE